MGGTLTRDEWLKLGGPEEPEPDWMITYPADPGERGVLCVLCWRKRLSTPTSSATDASQLQSS
jgi:hypothetical protein